MSEVLRTIGGNSQYSWHWEPSFFHPCESRRCRIARDLLGVLSLRCFLLSLALTQWETETSALGRERSVRGDNGGAGHFSWHCKPSFFLPGESLRYRIAASDRVGLLSLRCCMLSLPLSGRQVPLDVSKVLSGAGHFSWHCEPFFVFQGESRRYRIAIDGVVVLSSRCFIPSLP